MSRRKRNINKFHHICHQLCFVLRATKNYSIYNICDILYNDYFRNPRSSKNIVYELRLIDSLYPVKPRRSPFRNSPL